jgi:LuxR family maltose regulon positive regulatory protein
VLDQEALAVSPPVPGTYTPLLRNKLVAPQLWPGRLERPELVSRLAAGAGPGRLTFVGAPVGCGKTTLLALLTRTVVAPATWGWYTADPADNSVRSFWAYVLAALVDAAGEAAEHAFRVLAAPGTTVLGDVLPALINDLTALSHPLALVIDDYDVITDPRIHRTVGFLVQHLPPTLSLIVSSRHRPPAEWRIGRLRGRNLLQELGPKDMRLTRAEAAGLLAREMGAPLPDADVDLLYDRTEGWCAGIHLAALSLRGRDDVHEHIASFSGTDRHIADYLMSELLDREPAATRTFLRRTSILERICAPLCDHLTGSGDAAGQLLRAECDQLFLVALDNRGMWFRFERLLRDILRRELDRTEPGLVPALHRRAAEWFQDVGMHTDAVRHAVAAGDSGMTRRLICDDYFRVASSGRVSTVVGWFEAIRDSILHADGGLLVARAMAALFNSDLDDALGWLDEAAGAAGDDPRLRGSVEAKTALVRQIHAYCDGDTGAAARLSHDALKKLGRYDVWYGAALSHAACADMRLDNDDAALHAFRRCLARAEASGDHLLAVHAMGGIARVYYSRGELELAREWTGRVERDERWQKLDEHCLTYVRHFVGGRLDLADGRPEAAEPRLLRALELVRRGPYRIEQAEVLDALAETHERLSRPDDASSLRTEARRILSRCRDPGRLIVSPSALKRVPAVAGLTEREVAVLRVLAEGLTNAQMARRLYVSERTVAAHLRAVYRKIGVANRSAATRYALAHHLVDGNHR